MRLQSAIYGVVAGMLATTPLRAQTDTAKPAASPSSLSETSEDWSVNCSVQNGARRCPLSQQQIYKGGQQVLALEFEPDGDAGLKGISLCPSASISTRGDVPH